MVTQQFVLHYTVSEKLCSTGQRKTGSYLPDGLSNLSNLSRSPMVMRPQKYPIFILHSNGNSSNDTCTLPFCTVSS